MSKKSSQRQSKVARPKLRNHKALIVAGLIISLLISSVVAARWGTFSADDTTEPDPPAPFQTQLPLAKEYIYAGSRLIATEEPTCSFSISPTCKTYIISGGAGTVSLTANRAATGLSRPRIAG